MGGNEHSYVEVTPRRLFAAQKQYEVKNMQRKNLKPAFPDDPLYQQTIEAMKRYDQAKADGKPEAEVEALRIEAEHAFQTVTDYQLEALGGLSLTRH
jgi:hypothetical protein